MKKQIMLLVAAVLTIATGYSRGAIKDRTTTTDCERWVDSVYNSLTPRERVGQLVIGHLDPTGGESTRAVLRKMIRDNKMGGILFSKGTAREYATMIDYAQSLANVPLMVTLDGEWGAAMRIPQAPHFPVNMALGAIDDPTLLYEYGLEVARECRELGIHVNFAPVMDVNSNPANPVIGQRSYGEDAHKVSQLGTYYSLGLEDGGVMAVAKHFPGHGDTNADSHKTLPTINRSYDQLITCDLVPFQTFINSGCSGIMVAHISVPALDASGTAASMSPEITAGLLCNSMHFGGLVFTDGLGMAGAVTKGNRCVEALKAGCDVLLGPPDYATDIDAVLKAVNNGVLEAGKLEKSVRKMLAYKYVLCKGNEASVGADKVEEAINTPSAERVNRRISDACATLIRNNGGLLPIGQLGSTSVAVVNIGAPADNEFADYCRRYCPVQVYSTGGDAFKASTLAEIRDHDVVIAAVYTDKKWAQDVLQSLRGSKKLVDVFFINPYKMGKFSTQIAAADAVLTVHYDTRYLRETAAKALFGGIKVNGRMPVGVSGVAALGDGITLQQTRLGFASPTQKGMRYNVETRLDSAVTSALKAGAFPGCQLMVVKDGDIIVDRCYGTTGEGGTRVTPHTLYDLASVSKAVGTLPGVMKAYDDGLFDLDRKISAYISELQGVEGKEDITPRMLLHHETGMPASLGMIGVMMDSATYTGKLTTSRRTAVNTIRIQNNLWGNKDARLRTDILSVNRSRTYPVEVARGIYSGSEAYDTVMGRIYDIPLRKNRSYNYSCLNFCLLMDMEQRLTGTLHEMWVADKVWAPLGCTFCYRPTERYPLSQIAPTEKDNYMRRQHVHGYVHDELAAFSGGVQGNAGVFGTATDVCKLCQMWLNGGVYGDARVLSEATTRLFTTEKSATCRRGLGFDKPDTENPKASPTTPLAPACVYGHLGFTGTVFWVDPQNNMIFVFLCNRVNPTRDNAAFRESNIRPELMRILYESI